jgi:hypothetical protein
MKNFTLPPEEDENNPVIERKVKAWTLSKMAKQFRKWNNRLNKFVKDKKTPDFEDPEYAKIRVHWPEFVAYKTSAEAKKRSEVNTVNANKKEYYQVTGLGGYMAQRLKWEKSEKDLRYKGIRPETSGWTLCVKTWFYGIGAKLDPGTGRCVFPKAILATPIAALKAAFEETREGKFHPDRENDELTHAIVNQNTLDEHEAHRARSRGRMGLPSGVNLRDGAGEKKKSVQTG